MHTATLLRDGRVLVVGGCCDDIGDLASAEVWDPTTSSFERAGSLPEAKPNHTATLLSDGRVLIAGGSQALMGSLPAEVAHVWDPVTSAFGPAGSLSDKRFGHSATLLSDGRVLIVGGLGGDAWARPAEVWDPVTSTFGPAGLLSRARMHHVTAPLPDGRALIVGGMGEGEAGSMYVSMAEIWDPATSTFEPAGSLPEDWVARTATFLPEGRVLTVGGRVDDAFASAEVWDPATSSFSTGGSAANHYGYANAELLSDGRVLVLLGADHVNEIEAEAWDPETSSFEPLGSASFMEPRSGHSRTVLPDGRVLVVGGLHDFNVFSLPGLIWEPTLD